MLPSYIEIYTVDESGGPVRSKRKWSSKRKLPDCSACTVPHTKDRRFYVVDMIGIAGSPSFGWHIDGRPADDGPCADDWLFKKWISISPFSQRDFNEEMVKIFYELVSRDGIASRNEKEFTGFFRGLTFLR